MKNKYFNLEANGKNRRKAVKNVLISSAFLFFGGGTLKGQIPTSDNQTDKYLLEDAKKSSYNKSHDKTLIPYQYLEYLSKNEITKCIANPKEKFNETDLVDTGLCRYRLVILGESLIFKNQWCIIYETGGVTGIERSCDFFEINDTGVISIATIYINPRINNFKRLKRALRDKQYFFKEIPPILRRAPNK